MRRAAAVIALLVVLVAICTAGVEAYEYEHVDRTGPAHWQATVTVTVYHAVPSQTDSNPFETADGTTFTKDSIANARICALSREYLARWGGPIHYGDIIWIDIDGPLGGPWYVHDTLGKDENGQDFRGIVDLLVPISTMERWDDITVSLVWRPSWHSSGDT